MTVRRSWKPCAAVPVLAETNQVGIFPGSTGWVQSVSRVVNSGPNGVMVEK